MAHIAVYVLRNEGPSSKVYEAASSAMWCMASAGRAARRVAP